jgi:hypothetical protein
MNSLRSSISTPYVVEVQLLGEFKNKVPGDFPKKEPRSYFVHYRLFSGIIQGYQLTMPLSGCCRRLQSPQRTIHKVLSMELSISDEKTKELLTEVMIELLKNKRDLIYDILLEALEEVGMANAIAEGRKNEFVSEEEVFSLLDRDAE